jgi:hypothetical protein
MSDIRVCVENHPEYVWIDSDDILHTAATTDGVFQSNLINTDDEFSKMNS